MRVKKLAAGLAVSGAVAIAGAGMTAGTALANTSGPHPSTAAVPSTATIPSTAATARAVEPASGWTIYGVYISDAECEGERVALLAAGAFGGPFISAVCVPVDGYWDLYAYHR